VKAVQSATPAIAAEGSGRSAKSPSVAISKPASPIQHTSAEEMDVGPIQPVAGPDPSSLTLIEAIETGLVQNPDLVALRQNEGVSAAAFGVAQTYPFNPFVQVRATPYQLNKEGGAGSMYNYVLVMQQVQLAHQQQFREQAAASQLNQVRWNICQAELLNSAQTARLYFTAIYQRGIRDLTRSNASLNEELLRISEQQAAAGVVTQADLAIVRIDLRSTRQQADLGEANYQSALLDLRRQLNIPLETPISLRGDLANFHWKSAQEAAVAQISQAGSASDLKISDKTIDGTNLIKQLAGGRPDLMAAQADIETAYANYRLANANRTPDLQIGPFYQRDDFGTYYLGFQAQMDLFVMNNGKPLVRQRVAEHSQRQVFWEQLVARAEVDATSAVDRYERARRLVEAARPEFATDLPAELQRLEAQFKENQVDVLRIFQGRQSLMQNRRASLDLLNELAQATALMTAATGIPTAALVEAGE
jgi:cobalt-zinc-cadmium efflux system outer membrane protein